MALSWKLYIIYSLRGSVLSWVYLCLQDIYSFSSRAFSVSHSIAWIAMRSMYSFSAVKSCTLSVLTGSLWFSPNEFNKNAVVLSYACSMISKWFCCLAFCCCHQPENNHFLFSIFALQALMMKMIFYFSKKSFFNIVKLWLFFLNSERR